MFSFLQTLMKRSEHMTLQTTETLSSFVLNYQRPKTLLLTLQQEAGGGGGGNECISHPRTAKLSLSSQDSTHLQTELSNTAGKWQGPSLRKQHFCIASSAGHAAPPYKKRQRKAPLPINEKKHHERFSPRQIARELLKAASESSSLSFLYLPLDARS